MTPLLYDPLLLFQIYRNRLPFQTNRLQQLWSNAPQCTSIAEAPETIDMSISAAFPRQTPRCNPARETKTR